MLASSLDFVACPEVDRLVDRTIIPNNNHQNIEHILVESGDPDNEFFQVVVEAGYPQLMKSSWLRKALDWDMLPLACMLDGENILH